MLYQNSPPASNSTAVLIQCLDIQKVFKWLLNMRILIIAHCAKNCAICIYWALSDQGDYIIGDKVASLRDFIVCGVETKSHNFHKLSVFGISIGFKH